MAINFLNSVNFNKNSVDELRVVNHVNDTAAGTGVTGQLYYNSTDNILKVYTGSEWDQVGGGVTSLTTTDGTFINLTPDSATTGNVTVTADLSATGTAGNTTFLRGDNAWAIPPGTYSFSVKADAAGTQTVASGQTVTILGGAGVATTLGTNNRTITIDGYAQWRLQADTGTTTAVTDGLRVDVAGGTYADTVVSTASGNVPTVTVNVDATTAATASKVVARDGDAYAYAATAPTGDNSTKLATTAFVETALTSALQFKGGFNATTGTIDGGTTNLTNGSSRVAIAVGDYYVCTTAGNFFGNANTPLTAGDSVIVKSAAAAGASVESDFVIVQSDTDVASSTQIGIGNVVEVTNGGVDVAYTNGSAAVKIDANDLTTGSGAPATVVGTDSSNNTKKFPFSSFHSRSGKYVVLDANTTGISVDTTTITGSTIYTINLSSSTATPAGVWDDSVRAKFVKVEVTKNTGTLDTVYAQVQRRDNSSPGGKSYIDITFVGTITNSDFVALLSNVSVS